MHSCREIAIRCIPLAAPLLLCVGCSGDGARSRAFEFAQVRDSSGVTIVHIGTGLSTLPVRFQIDTTFTLDLGGARASPEQELDAGAGEQEVRRLSDGRFVVKNTADFKVFDSAGAYVASMGRAGDGPGEFRYLSGICVTLGDTIAGIEEQRATLFTAAGELVRTFTSAASGSAFFDRSGCFADGSLLTRSDSRPDPMDEAYRVANARIASSTGRRLVELGAVEDGFSSFTIPVVPGSAVGADYAYIGDGRAPLVKMYDTAGALRRIIRWTDAGIPVTDEFLRQLMQRMRPGASEEELGTMVARAMASPQPATVPHYQQMKTDETGRLWLFDYPNLLNLREWQPTWTIFADDGAPLGRVLVPSLSRAEGAPIISAVGSDYVFLTWRDKDLGFKHLTQHRLRDLGCN